MPLNDLPQECLPLLTVDKDVVDVGVVMEGPVDDVGAAEHILPTETNEPKAVVGLRLVVGAALTPVYGQYGLVTVAPYVHHVPLAVTDRNVRQAHRTVTRPQVVRQVQRPVHQLPIYRTYSWNKFYIFTRISIIIQFDVRISGEAFSFYHYSTYRFFFN